MRSFLSTHKSNQLLWLSDLHLDKATTARKLNFYREVCLTEADTILVTGDISIAKLLPLHLRELAAAASPRQVYFLLGNHDFFGSDLTTVDAVVTGVCNSHNNLQHLGGGEIIGLSPHTALVGHRGWYDGRMGWGSRTVAWNPDFQAIKDFQGLTQEQRFLLLNRLGQDSASYFRSALPLALTTFRHVIVATHVPPYSHGACFNRKPCDRLRQPFYTNISAGAAIMKIAEHFPKSKMTILSGHTHSAATIRISSNIVATTGGAKPGFPDASKILEITDTRDHTNKNSSLSRPKS